MRRRTVLLVLAAATAAAALGAWSATGARDTVRAATTPATSLGFGEPRTLVGDEGVSLEDVALAPSGRVALLWRTADFERDRYAYEAAIGDDLAGLGAGAAVRAGKRSARDGGEPQLVAFRDGSFAACFVTDPRKGDAVASCSFAPPTGGFGPERVVARAPWQQRLALTVAPRPDGRLAAVVSQLDGRARRSRSTLVRFDGTATKPVTVFRGPRDTVTSLAALDDGTLAFSATAAPADALGGRGELRVMGPDAERFAPPVAYTADEVASFSGSLSGGRGLSISYVPGSDGRERDARVVLRKSDGSLATPQSLPRPAAGSLGGYATTMPDGSTLAVASASEENETDCSNLRSAVVGAGPLVAPRPFENGTDPEDDAAQPITAERLSAARQFGLYARLAALDDGTAVVVWGNSANAEEHLRLEAAFRPPGADRFGARRQVLPDLSTGFNFFLESAGDRAVLVWAAGKPKLEDMLPRRIVGAELRRGGPFAAPAPRPEKPVSPCS